LGRGESEELREGLEGGRGVKREGGATRWERGGRAVRGGK